MGKVKSQQQWQQILADQKTSGLTIVDYCRQHQLSTSNFYLRRKQLATAEYTFIEAKITKQTEVVVTPLPITITLGKATVSLPGTTTAAYLGQLLREFA
ncbi:IS66 family insertion sequence element accessory protein TnpA [Thalassomonas haliotis]|uniref:IS66 family insertion sequence element accessory protein TnpB n=1 Tax=Thalassomonas haliotis TaxID=485448 RepID=A0ABY7VDR1_9GAMM|nr:IS66 family insertion sequence element accessory protein TnpB [Thalassomonas haliotis]WDE11854.1 IS66 family insertion sequence element accessory protein TnpB [Thalassomonas haliotis]